MSIHKKGMELPGFSFREESVTKRYVYEYKGGSIS